MIKWILLNFVLILFSLKTSAQFRSFGDSEDQIIIEDLIATQYLYNQKILAYEGFNMCSKMPFRIVKKEFICNIKINDSTNYKLRKITVNFGLKEFNDLISKEDTVQVDYYLLKGSETTIKLFGFISSDLCKLIFNSNDSTLAIVASELERKKILTNEESKIWKSDVNKFGRYFESINKPSNLLALFYGNSKESQSIFIQCKPLRRSKFIYHSERCK